MQPIKRTPLFLVFIEKKKKNKDPFTYPNNYENSKSNEKNYIGTSPLFDHNITIKLKITVLFILIVDIKHGSHYSDDCSRISDTYD